jgi:hypothetical protein
MTEWISVKDKLPELGSRVLAYGNDSDREFGITTVDYVKYSREQSPSWAMVSSGCGCCDSCLNVSHWMPLPEAPNE